MRQVLYFSETKSRQFMREHPRLSRPSGVTGELSIPFVGAKISTAASSNESDAIAKKITRITRLIEKSPRKPHWYEDAEISDGHLIRFEAKLGYAIVTSRSHRMLFFGPSPDLASQVALLLYGSPRHLLASPSEPATVDIKDMDSYPHSLAKMLEEVAEDEGEALSVRGISSFEHGAISMAERVNQHCLTFPTFRGYAQVIGSFDCANRIFLHPGDGSTRRPSRLIVASPLFVEYA